MSTPLQPLHALLSDRTIGPAAKLAFLVLWDFAGGQPGQLTVTADWLGQQCGRDRRTALGWLEELRGHGLVTIGERDRRRGKLELFLYAPHPATAERPTDPQQRLPIPPAETEDPARGDFCAETPARKNPRGDSCAETPAQETANSQRKTGHPAVRAGVSAQKPPRHAVCVNEFKEVQESITATSQRISSKVNEFNESLGAALAAALDRVGERTSPSAQKARLKTRIRDGVGRHVQLADYVAGAAADMVIFGGVPLEDLERILVEISALRGAGKLRSASGFFHVKARELAARHGFKWPGKASGECVVGSE